MLQPGRLKEVPDIAIEVVVTHGAIDKLEVYRGLGIREVWTYEKGVFSLFALRGERYETIAKSEVLAEIDLAELAHFAQQADQHAALVAYRDSLRR